MFLGRGVFLEGGRSDEGGCTAGQSAIIWSEGGLYLGTVWFLGIAVFLEGGRSDEGWFTARQATIATERVCTSEP